MEGVVYEVFDDQFNEDVLQKDLLKPEKRITRSNTNPNPVLEYSTFTRSNNPNCSYFRSVLKSKVETLTYQQTRNFILNLFLPLPMVGSMVKSSRRRVKEDRRLGGFLAPLLTVQEVIAGSSTEGLGLPQLMHVTDRSFSVEAPDEDTKFVFSQLVVASTESTKGAFAFLEVCRDIPPSFTKLRVNREFLARNGDQKHFNFSSVVTAEGYIDRLKFVRLLLSVLKEHIYNDRKELSEFRCKEGSDPSISYSQHGPAVTVDIVDKFLNVCHSKDYVLSFPCPKWPEQAKEWAKRQRVWPCKAIIRRVVRDGCHIVTKAHRPGRTTNTEFMFSFSLSDRTICQTLSSNQRRCYMLFKYIFKHHLNKVKRGLTSYFCKLTFLWLCERKSADEWREDNPLECLVVLLKDFKSYLSRRNLPSYYIPEHNMLAEMSATVLRACETDIDKVLVNPCQVIMDIAEKHRFLWLSKDVSFSQLLCNISMDNELSRQLVVGYILNFLSIMLDKGEIHLVLSIICEKWACEILPETNETIKALELLLSIHEEENVDLVCLKGLLATMYHQSGEERGGEWHEFEKGLDMFRDMLNNVENHIWIYAAFYDLLFAVSGYEDLIRHFLTKLHPRGAKKDGRLLEPGIYTVFTPHNNLTAAEDNFAEISTLFVVPSTAYIIYRVIQTYLALSRERIESHEKQAYKAEAVKVVHFFEKRGE